MSVRRADISGSAVRPSCRWPRRACVPLRFVADHSRARGMVETLGLSDERSRMICDSACFEAWEITRVYAPEITRVAGILWVRGKLFGPEIKRVLRYRAWPHAGRNRNTVDPAAWIACLFVPGCGCS